VRDIYTVSSKGGESDELTEGSHVITDLSWSPDGDRVAFIGHDEPGGLAINNGLWVMTAEGGDKINVTDRFDRSIGHTIGTDLRVSTPNPGAVWAAEGDEIFFVNDATHPAEIWVIDDDGERRVTGFNDRLLKGLDLSVPEHFTFRNGLGDEVDGWFMRPPGAEEDGEYPALLEIHGGPRGAYGNGMFHEFQILAAEGYAVFYTNPRGSAGYGEDFAEAVMRHYGECDYEDLMLFTDEVLKRFNSIDVKRLGVLGGSYGGYMTNWIIGHTHRFAAAVTYRSICNWISKFGVSDMGYMQPEAISGTKDIWDDILLHLDRSPIRYVKNVETPCLVIHSEDDLRVPMEQGEQWFVSLKLNGVPTELIRFPDETHELSRSGKPGHREERLRHTVRWFDRYLKEPE